MYNDVYKSLVQSENAEKSNEFSSEYDSPFKTNFKLTHPENCLVVDEIGSNISQKGDGHIAGKKYVCEIDLIPKEQASHTDKHFTLLEFTALSGEPVLHCRNDLTCKESQYQPDPVPGDNESKEQPLGLQPDNLVKKPLQA